MTPHELSQIESKLSAAVLKALEDGHSIIMGEWGVNYKFGRWEPESPSCCLCPMGAFLIGRNNVMGAASCLGVSYYEVEEFIKGFDGNGPTDSSEPMYLLGKRFRLRILGLK